MTTALLLTMSAVNVPGLPAAAITMSAWRVCRAKSLVPVWHMVTVALAFGPRWVSNIDKGRPTKLLRPMMVTLAPGMVMPASVMALWTPSGVAGTNLGFPMTSSPAFSGWSPSTSFMGSMLRITASVSMWSGSGSCTSMPWNLWSELSSDIDARSCSWVV